MSLVQVTFHSSQFPEKVRRDLVESLRTRRVNHKFHYDSVRQTHRWLALHEAYSPARTDPQTSAIYDRSFEITVSKISAERVHLIGLGCGSGQKDARLLACLAAAGKQAHYTPCDVSSAMVLVARRAALEVIPEERCYPLVCDLATIEDLRRLFEEPAIENAARLITFFGMMPNFEPEQILPGLTGMVCAGDQLLMSANLAPGPDYHQGVRRILPLYDNALTRDWLMTFLLDVGIEQADGHIHFGCEENLEAGGLKRITAEFQFTRRREIQVEGESFKFAEGESIQLFFSYRHTPGLMRSLLNRYSLRFVEQWISPSEEEGVFLVGKD